MEIALCICTCDRPEALAKALAAIEKLEFDGNLRVIVVENHAAKAGMRVCEKLAAAYRLPLICRYEARPGISQARNACLTEALTAPVDFVFTIDDDAFPARDWLKELIAEQQRTGADFLCGPVEPFYESPPPRWIEQGNFFHFGPSLKTGNLLLRAEILRGLPRPWFDETLGLSGGEDTKFLQGLLRRNYRFAPCASAVVYESVPAGRMRLGYLLRRAIRKGNCTAFFHRRNFESGARADIFTAIGKIGYGLNHLFWHMFSFPSRREHLGLAIEDFGESVGIALALSGYLYQFYDERHGRPARFRRT